MPIQTQTHSEKNSVQTTHKYNKVNQQKKFHLLTLIYREKMSIQEV